MQNREENLKQSGKVNAGSTCRCSSLGWAVGIPGARPALHLSCVAFSLARGRGSFVCFYISNSQKKALRVKAKAGHSS